MTDTFNCYPPSAAIGLINVMEVKLYPYVYRWNRLGRKGQRCNVTARGKLNSCRVEFPDGFVMISSRNAIRKAQP